MRIHSVKALNFRPFSELTEIKFGPFSTIIGQNDVGKSNILRALELFFQHGTSARVDETDVHDKASPDADIIIEVAFTELPETLEIEQNVPTTFTEEKLVDKDGFLRIRKVYPRKTLAKYEVYFIVNDYDDKDFAYLTSLTEPNLNKLGEQLSLSFKKSGSGITNKDKRKRLREYAAGKGIPLNEKDYPISKSSELWKAVVSSLPEFRIFETDTKLGVGETKFQSEFREIIDDVVEAEGFREVKDTFTSAIGGALQGEIDKIFNKMRQHTDTFEGLTAKPKFTWDKAVNLDIYGKDGHGVEVPLDRRGSGLRRLLMVAFFQYLAEKNSSGLHKCIYAVEEPENCLHPGLQRELVDSFRKLAGAGYQVIITSHSPVFAGEAPLSDLLLVLRKSGVATALQFPDFEVNDVARELGIDPSDGVTTYRACVFTEGPQDVEFFKTVASKFKTAGLTTNDFDELGIGLLPCGGDNLKCWVDLEALSRISRKFAVIVDSDKTSVTDAVPGKKLILKKKCEDQGGVFFILRKREIENYLHLNGIARSGRPAAPFDDYTDMKKTFGPNVYKVIEVMTFEEICERDTYRDGASEGHELEDIIIRLHQLIND